MLKENIMPSKVLYLVKTSYKNKGKMKIFPDRQNLREFFILTLTLKEIIKDVLQEEKKKRDVERDEEK